MKHQYNRVVVLLNDFEKIDTLLERAINFSKEHNTILEILYVHEEPLFDIPDYFLSDEKINENKIDPIKIKEKIQSHLDTYNLTESHAILVYLDDTVDRLLTHLSDAEHTLIVTTYNEALTTQLISKTPYSYWIIKNNNTDTYANMVFPSDLSDESKKVIGLTQHIFSSSRLHLLYDYRYILDTLAIREDYLNVTPVTIEIDTELNEQKKAEEKERFNDYKKEFNIEGTFLEGEDLLEDDLAKFIKDNFDLTIIYRRDEELFSSPSLILSLMKKVSSDFFVI